VRDGDDEGRIGGRGGDAVRQVRGVRGMAATPLSKRQRQWQGGRREAFRA